MSRTKLLIPYLTVVLMVAGLVAPALATTPATPIPPWATNHEKPLTDDVKAPAHRGPNSSVMPTPERAPEGIDGGVIDLRQIQRSAEPDPNQPHRYHIQGEFYQEQGKSLVRQPVSSTEHDNPAAIPEENQSKSTTAFGAQVTSWNAETYSGWIPPDEVFAVGPQYVIEAVNSGFSVYSKTGTETTSYTDFENFVFLPSPWNGFCYDPRLLYDTYNDRFVMTIMGLDQTNLKSYIFLMVSTTNDPNGSWYQWRFDMSRGAAGSEQWLDYSGLGVDNFGLYFTGNYYTFTDAWSSSVIVSYSNSYITGTASGGYIWNDPQWPNTNDAGSIQPAHPHSTNGAGGTFFFNTYSGSGTEGLLWTLTGKRWPDDPEPDPVSLTNTVVSLRQYYAIGSNVNQPDSATDIDGGDCRMMNAVYFNGKIYGVIGIDPDADSSNGESYAFGVTTGGTKSWDYTIWANDYWYTYPSITIDGADWDGDPNWFVGHTTTSDAGSVYASSTGFTLDTATPATSFYYDFNGSGSYVRTDNGGRNRWGDYSLSAYDPTCGHVWSVQEYATSSNTWATRIFARTAADEDPCVYIRQGYPNGGESFTAGDAVSLEWDKLNLPASDELWFMVDDHSGTTEWYGPFSTSSSSYTWNVPNFNGAFDMCAGSWDSATYSATDWSDNTFTITGLPDLDVTTFTGQASAEAGATFSVSNTVTNIGPVTAWGTATTNIYLSADTSCSIFDTLIGTRDIVNLNAGAASSDSTSVTIPGSTAADSYYLCIWTDAGPIPDVTEFNEVNNADYYAFSVTASAPIFVDDFESGNTNAWSATSP